MNNRTSGGKNCQALAEEKTYSPSARDYKEAVGSSFVFREIYNGNMFA
jgi:hypothetical protein